MGYSWSLKVRQIMIGMMIVGFSATSFAQQSGAQGTEEGKRSGGPRKQLATIIFAGLGGAVLGLSTLSFYGRPQDKLSNIAVGFAVGVIVGTSYVTYKAATNPQEFYATRPRNLNDGTFATKELELLQPKTPIASGPSLGLTMTF